MSEVKRNSRTPNKARIKRDYLAGMTPAELAKKYHLRPNQVHNFVRRGKWAEEREQLVAKVAQSVVQSEVEAITAMKEMERKDMYQLLEYARSMVDPNKPSAFKVKAASDVMKTAYERLYKSFGIADKLSHSTAPDEPFVTKVIFE
jgi:hypothetical protein